MSAAFRMAVQGFNESAHRLSVQLLPPPLIRLNRVGNAYPSFVFRRQKCLHISSLNVCLSRTVT
eukprot:3783802-Karenia_brevis.AAC.1